MRLQSFIFKKIKIVKIILNKENLTTIRSKNVSIMDLNVNKHLKFFSEIEFNYCAKTSDIKYFIIKFSTVLYYSTLLLITQSIMTARGFDFNTSYRMQKISLKLGKEILGGGKGIYSELNNFYYSNLENPNKSSTALAISKSYLQF